MNRVVVITTSFPRGTGGSEAAGSFVEDFCRLLAAHCRLAVVAPGAAESLDAGDGFQIYRYAAPEKALSLLRPWRAADLLDTWRVLRTGARASSRAAVDIDADYLFALWALPCGYWARSVARTRAIRFGVWCLGSDIWTLGRIPLVRTMLGRVLRDAGHCYADGYELAARVAELAGKHCAFLPSSRVLPAAVAAPVRAAPPYRLGFLGRWHPNKGVDLLLDALEELPAESWADISEVRLAGGGPMAVQVRQRVRQLADRGHPVRCEGYLDRPQACAFIAGVDYLLIPSRIESIPVIFSDAMQCSRPVVCTPVGDLPRIMREHRVGSIAGGANARSFAEAVTAALKIPPSSFLPAIRSLAPQFDLARAVQQLLSADGRGPRR